MSSCSGIYDPLMASYLLKGSDEDLARWKADAESAGVSFAEHVRARLDADPTPAPQAKQQRRGKAAKEEPAKVGMCIHRVVSTSYCSRCAG